MIKKLQLKGKPREIGEAHGREGKEQVMQSLETYESLFSEYRDIPWKKAQELALRHVDAIEKYDFDFIEEMEGVAKGAGVDFEDILVLNTRSEIALTYQSKPAFTDGCTAIAIMAPLTSETMIGQNWDWKAKQIQSLLLLEIEQEGKPNIKMVTEGGIIGKIGFNSKGLGVLLNALHTNNKSEQVPIHLGLRAVLNSSSLGEAIARVKDGQMASPANFLIASDEGQGRALAANVEVSAVGIDMLFPTNGWLVHTNHLLSETLKVQIQDLNDMKFEDSMIRKSRAEQLIQMALQSGNEINENVFKEWFSDRFNAPNSICHQENVSIPEPRRMETVFSIIMNLTKQSMQLCVGKPEVSNYVSMNL